MNRNRKLIFVFMIAAVAIFLRLYAIDRLPPGLFGDEAVEGLDALDVMAGNLAIWFHAHLGREPMFVYLVALSYSALGITPLATRLPAIVAGLLTLPAAFWCVREWALTVFARERATRLALLTTALLAISFWHIQMTRDAHRDTLLPLVEAIGYAFLWRAMRTRSVRSYIAAGAILGLAVYTYSPGRFVGIFVAVFFAVELGIELAIKIAAKRNAGQVGSTESGSPSILLSNALQRLKAPALYGRGLAAAAMAALVVMMPLGIYFAQNPVQFSRRFASVSIFDFDLPLQAFASSVAGNLGQFVVPGAGYASTHYNLPGKPVFDLLIAPWFLLGLAIAFARARHPAHRFLILWFVLMATPAFLTADMIPKGVRVLGVVPGVFVFPALAMDFFIERFHATIFQRRAIIGLIAVSLFGSVVWTTYDYFSAWANLPELPLAFDSDMVEISDYINRQPGDQPIFVSAEVYRHPTFMLLGKHVPTSQYFDRSTRVREFDARTSIVTNAAEQIATDLFVRDYMPSAEWLTRVAPQAKLIQQGTYFSAYRLGAPAAPQHALDGSFNPFLKMIGYSRYDDDPMGIVVEWQVVKLPDDRVDMQAVLSLLDARSNVVTQSKHSFGVPPMEWAAGDMIVEWYETELPAATSQFTIQLTRGADVWQSAGVTFSGEPQ
ncbi:MAG TPA: glycosyltransferase family 39 protein [Anaerolineae bacterium]